MKGPGIPASAYRLAWYVSRKSPRESRKTSGSISKTPGISVAVTRTLILSREVRGFRSFEPRTSNFESHLSRLTRRRAFGIDDVRRFGVQLPESIDQRLRGWS